MVCEPSTAKNYKVSSSSKCTSAEISGSNLAVSSSANGWKQGERFVSSSPDERNAFWLKCGSAHAICEKTRRISPRVYGWADFIVHPSCTPWVLFNSLQPFPPSTHNKKVSSPHVKCKFFCSKVLKKVVSYLTSVLKDSVSGNTI